MLYRYKAWAERQGGVYCYVPTAHRHVKANKTATTMETTDIDPKMHYAHAVDWQRSSGIVWDSHPLKHSMSNTQLAHSKQANNRTE